MDYVSPFHLYLTMPLRSQW